MPMAFSVKDFCKEFNISRSKLYALWREGKGPAYLNVGKRRLISAVAADAWRAKLEGEAAQAHNGATPQGNSSTAARSLTRHAGETVA